MESSLSGRGYTCLFKSPITETRDLLGPLKTTAYMGMNTLFEDKYNHSTSAFFGHTHTEPDDSSTEGVLDRWTNYLSSLPSHIPVSDARLLLHYFEEVGSAALRDIIMAQALSFGSWWVSKVWVDEMLQWLAEKGGFM